MNAIAKMSDHSGAQLALIKRTVAKDLTDDEFSMFIELCRRNRLDPFRGQASPVVFSAKSRDKRRVALVVGIDGLRAIADRMDTYAPDEAEPEYEFDESLKGPTNPLGIVKCTVYVNKLRGGRWFRTPGVAYWSEFAPVTQVWADDGTGQRRPTGASEVGGKWKDMPRHMIAIAAERQALRKGWPDAFGDVYAEEEVQRQALEVDAAEAVEKFNLSERQKKLGGSQAVLIQFEQNTPIERVPLGKVADRLLDHIGKADAYSELGWWRDVNRHALQEFWALAPGEALEVKRALEAKLEALAPRAELEALEA